MKRSLHMLAAVAVLLILGGCALRSPAASPRASKPPRPLPAEWPSIEERADGTLRVVGTLRQSPVEGGFWVVDVDRPEDHGRSGLHVVVASALPAGFGEGDYVAVEGTRSAGVSFRMAGPEMKVTRMSLVATPILTHDPIGPPRWSAALPSISTSEVRVSGFVVETHFSPAGSYALLASRPTYDADGRPLVVVRTRPGAVFELGKLQGVWVTVGGAQVEDVPEGVSREWRGAVIVLADSIALEIFPQQGGPVE